jgi:hypothetical protein
MVAALNLVLPPGTFTGLVHSGLTDYIRNFFCILNVVEGFLALFGIIYNKVGWHYDAIARDVAGIYGNLLSLLFYGLVLIDLIARIHRRIPFVQDTFVLGPLLRRDLLRSQRLANVALLLLVLRSVIIHNFSRFLYYLDPNEISPRSTSP